MRLLGTRPAANLAVAVVTAALSSCSTPGGSSPDTSVQPTATLPADARGLFLVDCWNDQATPFDPATAAGTPALGGGSIDDVDCATVAWIDADHLLCGDSSGEPTVVALTAAALLPAAQYGADHSCWPCYQRDYIWLIPADARFDLTPASSRELFGFRADPASGLVYFLADNGTTLQLYAATAEPQSVPRKLGEIPVGEDPSGSSWTDLMIR